MSYEVTMAYRHEIVKELTNYHLMRSGKFGHAESLGESIIALGYEINLSEEDLFLYHKLLLKFHTSSGLKMKFMAEAFQKNEFIKYLTELDLIKLKEDYVEDGDNTLEIAINKNKDICRKDVIVYTDDTVNN